MRKLNCKRFPGKEQGRSVLNELNQKIEQLRNDLNNKKIEQNKAIQDVQIKDGDLKRIELQEQESTLR